MKKQLLPLIFTLFSAFLMAQDYATDFSCNDCSGVSHELFKELEAGKVIVLVWVMPCGACTGPALTAYNIVKDFQLSNPNKVFYYMVDDYANTNCQSLNSWCSSNGIDQSTYSLRFSNPKIKMTDYGSDGMPKIVVVAGSEHKVYYNVNNTVNPIILQKAINTALILTATNEENVNDTSITISPNPAKENSIISFTLQESFDTQIELLNSEGKVIESVYSGKLPAGINKVNLHTTNYISGLYYIRLTYNNHTKFTKFTIVH